MRQRHQSPGGGGKFFAAKLWWYNGVMTEKKEPTWLKLPSKASTKARAWWRFYWGEAKGNSVEAAKLAGFGAPATDGNRLKTKYRQLIAQQEDLLDEVALFTPKDIMKRLAELAENADRAADRIRALELLGKYAGLEKVDIRLDKKDVLEAAKANVDAALKIISAQADAKLLSPLDLPEPDSDKKSYVNLQDGSKPN